MISDLERRKALGANRFLAGVNRCPARWPAGWDFADRLLGLCVFRYRLWNVRGTAAGGTSATGAERTRENRHVAVVVSIVRRESTARRAVRRVPPPEWDLPSRTPMSPLERVDWPQSGLHERQPMRESADSTRSTQCNTCCPSTLTAHA